tara:strand:+ start:6736 stop:7359 length:624 start_codon:yes stop_codon:yes gene_type:complete
MTAAPAGLSKSDGENDGNAAVAEAEKTKAETKAPAKKATTRPNNVPTGNVAGGAAAAPEEVSKPGDEMNPDPTIGNNPNTDAVEQDGAGDNTFIDVPNANASVPEGRVEVTRAAQPGEPHDAGGRVTEQKDIAKKSTKADPLADIDHTKLPASVSVGDVIMSVDEYAGRPVLSLSLRGWVGDPPFKVLATDVGQIEGALEELRKVLK